MVDEDGIGTNNITHTDILNLGFYITELSGGVERGCTVSLHLANKNAGGGGMLRGCDSVIIAGAEGEPLFHKDVLILLKGQNGVHRVEGGGITD